MKTIRCLLLTVLSLFLLWKSSEVFNTNAIPIDDFVAYWAASRLQLQRLNPYSASEILAVERAVGMRGDEPLIMLNPPWTLAFLLPFGFLDYPAGRLAWLLLALSSVFLSAHWLWLVYQGPHHSLRLALALAFCFVPLLVCLILGQITPLILLGVSGFLYFEGRSKPLSAGVCLVLLTLKPQLFYLFWLALFLWVLHDPQRSASASLADSHFRHLPPVLVWNSGFVAPIPPYASGMRLVGLPLETSPAHVGLEATDAGVAPGFAGYGFLRLGVRSGGVAALPLAGDWLDSEARG